MLVRVTDASVRTVLVLTNVDQLGNEECAGAQASVAVILEAWSRNAPVYPCSARRAMEARHYGKADAGSALPGFEIDFRRYLTDDRDTDLPRPLAPRALSLTEQMLLAIRCSAQSIRHCLWTRCAAGMARSASNSSVGG